MSLRLISVVVVNFLWFGLVGGPSYAQSIIDGAKKDGRVVFYASMEAQSAQRLVAQFEKKYPFIKVDAIRIGSERMATRLIAEAQGHKVQADVVNQSGFDFYGVLQKGIFESYPSPERASLPPEYKDEHGLWTINSATLNVIGYNTKLVPAAMVPKSFWDLADPKWKGQLLMDENESKWMAGMITYYGEAKVMELLRRLATQEIQFRVGHTLIQTLAAAGERPIVVVAFANGVERLKKDGAPIDWVAVDPIIGLTFGLGLVKDAPHPNAARLFIDFLLSREGQEILAAVGYYAPRTDVVSPLMKQAPPQMKVVPLPMSLATRYNEYFQTYRKVMGLK
ncbi:MAG TPA: extracellular solute-binding protein [Candidatus Binatia bacterium]